MCWIVLYYANSQIKEIQKIGCEQNREPLATHPKQPRPEGV